jgi:hypothetical protein
MHQIPRIGWPLLTYALLLGLMGCGKGFKDMEEKEEFIPEGQYVALLEPVNARKRTYRGWVKIRLTDNQIWVRIKLNGPGIKTIHSQYLQTGEKCPNTDEDDTNADGYVDVKEGKEKFGSILIPLDTDLSSQMKGIANFPFMRQQGFYFYSESASSRKMLNDLRSAMSHPEDMMVKLANSEGLDLERRTIVIYGIPENDRLPDTVATFGGNPRNHALPVACGELKYTNEEMREP